MMDARVFLLLLPGVTAFLIHNSHTGLCLEDAGPEVLLQKCLLDSAAQQWVWTHHGMLMCVATSRCLSPRLRDPVQTQPCLGLEVDPTAAVWDCDRDRLISRNTSMMLSIQGRRLTLTYNGRHSRWRSTDDGDICQEKLRSRRASDDPEEIVEEQTGGQAAMTDQQREFLRWYYRTEDPTMWKFVLLGLAFVCLLVGFLLLGMGAMASKNRRKIAKYKAAVALAHRGDVEELRVISHLRDDNAGAASPQRPLLQAKPSPFNGDVSEHKAGNIIVTWKDGNTSCLYPDPDPVVVTEPPLKEDMVLKEPEKEATTEEPEKEAVTEEPQKEVVTEEPEKEAVTEEPEKEATTEEPETEAVTEEPEKEATTEEPETEAVTEEPEKEATTEEPETEAVTEEPEKEAVAEGGK